MKNTRKPLHPKSHRINLLHEMCSAGVDIKLASVIHSNLRTGRIESRTRSVVRKALRIMQRAENRTFA